MARCTAFALCVKWEIYTLIYNHNYILITLGGISGWCIKSFEWIHQAVMSAEPTGRRGCLFGFDAPLHHGSSSRHHPRPRHSARPHLPPPHVCVLWVTWYHSWYSWCMFLERKMLFKFSRLCKLPTLHSFRVVTMYSLQNLILLCGLCSRCLLAHWKHKVPMPMKFG